MIPEGNLRGNIDRFLGYANDYDRVRPAAPSQAIWLLTRYLGRKPNLVIDIGCGTGLSTFIWENGAAQIIGVEPNPDMISKAREKLAETDSTGRISFVEGYSNELDVPDQSADIVTCSQSFHWMEPVSTIHEVSRVLKDGGIFAAYDCDWPPTVHWSIEDSYNRLIHKSDNLLSTLDSAHEKAVKREKEQHLSQLRNSGAFRFTKEIVFHQFEECDANRYAGLAISQGGLQTVLKLGSTQLDEEIFAFRRSVEQYFAGQVLEVMFSYRMRLGVK